MAGEFFTTGGEPRDDVLRKHLGDMPHLIRAALEVHYGIWGGLMSRCCPPELASRSGVTVGQAISFIETGLAMLKEHRAELLEDLFMADNQPDS